MQVIGFARANLNEEGNDERTPSVLVSEGGVDLYIFHEITGADPAVVREIEALPSPLTTSEANFFAVL